MRRVLLAIVLAFGFVSPVWADFQAGLDASKRGDFTTALREWKPLAEAGNADAQYNLGYLYEKGQGVAKDFAEAMKWYGKAADQGDARALGNIGYLYQKGLGVKKDYAEAFKWYRKAAKLGNAVAQNNLGVYYRKGLGVPKDITKALSWFRAAAEKGSVLAQINLGKMYRKGDDVAKDYAESAKWYKKAAKQNHPGAQALLGYFYEKGIGVPQDYVKAFEWYRPAAPRNKFAAKAFARLEGDPKIMRQVKKAQEQRLAEDRRLQEKIGRRLIEKSPVAKEIAEELRQTENRRLMENTRQVAELRLAEEARRRLVKESQLPAELAAKLVAKLRQAEKRRLEEDTRLAGEQEAEAKAIQEKALRLRPLLLAYLFLTSFYDDLWLRNSREKFAAIRKATTGEFKIVVTPHTPDSKGQQITLRTLEEIDQFTVKNRLLRIVYEKAIRKRGSMRFLPKYGVRLSPDCGAKWFSSGDITVQQNGFKLDISQPGRIFSGVVVEDAVMIIRPPAATPTLVGKFEKSIKLKDINSKCRIILTPK